MVGVGRLIVQNVRNPFRQCFRFDEGHDAEEQRHRFHDAWQHLHRCVVAITDSPIQDQFHHRPADERGGDETDEQQGSAFGRVHASKPSRFSGNGGLSDGSCGVAPTSPRYSVWRLNFNSAARPSVPSAETATAGRSYFPSGKANRKLNVPSERNLISWPPSVTLAFGSVAP